MVIVIFGQNATHKTKAGQPIRLIKVRKGAKVNTKELVFHDTTITELAKEYGLTRI